MTQLAYNQAQAAKLLGVGVNTFKANVRPYIACVWIGNSRRYTHAELSKWLDRESRSL